MDDGGGTAANAFERGLALFNQGRFFACHEAWEIAWQETQGAERNVLQGLIQAAVALLHLERGNLRGAQSVYAKGRARLDAAPADALGIDLADFRVALDRYLAAATSTRRRSEPPLIRRSPSDG